MSFKSLPVGVAAAGTNEIVPAVTGKKIRVIGLALIAAAAASFHLKSGGGSELFGTSARPVQLAANGGFVLPQTLTPAHWFETNPGEALVLNLVGAASVAGCVVYVEVD